MFQFFIGYAPLTGTPGVAGATATVVAPSATGGAVLVYPGAAEATATVVAPSAGSLAVIVSPGVATATATVIAPVIGYPKAVVFTFGAEANVLFDEWGAQPPVVFRFETSAS